MKKASKIKKPSHLLHNFTSKHSSLGEVKIISGCWRGRKLPVLTAEGLRPTGNRIKETLFNWLAPYIVDAHCLDAFAGSGSLGFEALSRGAKSVVFIENNLQAANQLTHNLQHFHCTKQQAQVVTQNTLTFLTQKQAIPLFEVVFIDPPFFLNLAQQTIDLLITQNWLAHEAFIYVETEKTLNLLCPENWTLLKNKTAGQVNYNLYQANAVNND